MATESHAIVFGAAGLLGWATLNQLLSGYPSSSPFSRVTAVLNRAVSEADLCLPSGPDRPSFGLVSGIDLLQATGDDLVKQLKEKVPGAEGITHVFYFVFAPFDDDHVQECNQNCGIMQRLADALNVVAPRLRSFVYPGGSRGYGIYNPGGVFQPPLEESMADGLPEDYAKTVAYPWFRQILTEASKDRNWTWSESSADKPIEVPFPGSEAGYRSLYTPVSGDILGRIAIHAALNPESCGGKIINMMDNDIPVSASDLWPSIAAWFGLKGVGPAEDDALKPSEYIDKYRHLFAQNRIPKGLTCGVGIGNQQLDSVGWWLTFDRQFSPTRLRSVGFTEQRDPVEGWLEAFERFREAGIIF
ncbi:hypothetical protein ANOM_009055 [Aspergillus nomiae NRRL 13137]|uniref:PRISE-like Rossmann-fold domain-containing protein n=1 Tax=Aspergillus nomiae NRRL (strain ATCC 15546 / NRRL 13137 / CBS 260.88 / M93) TaxID=1509407 RepID=A0A0L1IVM1_ASPN3|nr:uncharacterized protein ANOM_009055 [Aspergillus nomiae NRRL 13137]KNG83243.1 hypothetical protein ANOM_009055 [Aspergillus nomiae NRRL 13137]